MHSSNNYDDVNVFYTYKNNIFLFISRYKKKKIKVVRLLKYLK